MSDSDYSKERLWIIKELERVSDRHLVLVNQVKQIEVQQAVLMTKVYIIGAAALVIWPLIVHLIVDWSTKASDVASGS